MALSPPLTLSLFRFAQALPQTPPSLGLSVTTLQNLVEALIDLLLDEGIAADFWVKSPEDSSWLGKIERYQQQEKPFISKVYYCFSDALEDKALLTSCIPIELPKNTQLQKDFFFVAMSPQFSALLLGRKDKIPNQMQVLFSCESSVTSTVLNTIKQAISFREKPVDRLRKSVNRSLVTDQSKFITNLLLKQAKYQDKIDQAEAFVRRSQEHQAVLDNSLHFKDELLSQVATEFCTPLSTMKTALSLLESRQLKLAQRKHYTSMLKGECDRQGALIGGLVELVGLEKLPQKTAKCVASVTDLVPGIVSTYQPLATEKGIRLGYTVTANLPLVACPSNWLKQIIINLLDNCLKFTPPGGEVSVVVSLAEEKVQLTFTDTGFGIAATDVKKIFNSFYRGRKTTIENTKGAGLGLTIVHHLLLRCGGSISVTSKLDQGSAFKVSLPVLLES